MTYSKLIINGMETIHNLKVESDVNALKLYHKEEVERKLIDSCNDLEFNEFYNYQKSDVEAKLPEVARRERVGGCGRPHSLCGGRARVCEHVAQK